jgi:hypothetical protein
MQSLPSKDKHHSRHTIIRIRDHRMPSRSFSLEDRQLDRHSPGTRLTRFIVVSFMCSITAYHILEVMHIIYSSRTCCLAMPRPRCGDEVTLPKGVSKPTRSCTFERCSLHLDCMTGGNSTDRHAARRSGHPGQPARKDRIFSSSLTCSTPGNGMSVGFMARAVSSLVHAGLSHRCF